MALATVVVIDSHGCCERIVTPNVCRFVFGSTSNVHVIGPEVVGSPSRTMVTVPLHVPDRKDCGVVGVVGAGDLPHAATAMSISGSVRRQKQGFIGPSRTRRH